LGELVFQNFRIRTDDSHVPEAEDGRIEGSEDVNATHAEEEEEERMCIHLRCAPPWRRFLSGEDEKRREPKKRRNVTWQFHYRVYFKRPYFEVHGTHLCPLFSHFPFQPKRHSKTPSNSSNDCTNLANHPWKHSFTIFSFRETTCIQPCP
jgi:hypothetical protein